MHYNLPFLAGQHPWVTWRKPCHFLHFDACPWHITDLNSNSLLNGISCSRNTRACAWVTRTSLCGCPEYDLDWFHGCRSSTWKRVVSIPNWYHAKLRPSVSTEVCYLLWHCCNLSWCLVGWFVYSSTINTYVFNITYVPSYPQKVMMETCLHIISTMRVAKYQWVLEPLQHNIDLNQYGLG